MSKTICVSLGEIHYLHTGDNPDPVIVIDDEDNPTQIIHIGPDSLLESEVIKKLIDKKDASKIKEYFRECSQKQFEILKCDDGEIVRYAYENGNETVKEIFGMIEMRDTIEVNGRIYSGEDSIFHWSEGA